jgi:hypothetical protein
LTASGYERRASAAHRVRYSVSDELRQRRDLFQQGYKFFMIALRDQENAQRIVREIKGLLPAAATA